MNEIVYVGKSTLTLNVPYHLHENWEFIYCTGGKGSLTFKDKNIEYEEGDIAIIPPGVVHSNQSFDGFTNIHINMNDAHLPYSEPTIIKDDANKHIFYAFNSMHYYFYNDIENKSLVISALGMLIISYFIVNRESGGISAIVQKIEANILDNFSNSYYDLNDYLQKFHFNNDYIRKLFKRELGVTPNQYLINKRLQTSTDLLRSKNNDATNVSDIATICGFRDPLYFSRLFKKKYGMSPSDYIKKKPVDRSKMTSDDQKVFVDVDNL